CSAHLFRVDSSVLVEPALAHLVVLAKLTAATGSLKITQDLPLGFGDGRCVAHAKKVDVAKALGARELPRERESAVNRCPDAGMAAHAIEVFFQRLGPELSVVVFDESLEKPAELVVESLIAAVEKVG